MAKQIFEKGSPLRFLAIFLSLFLLFYYFNIFFFGLTSPGNRYNDFLARHLNYIQALRTFLLAATKTVLSWFGFTSIYNATEILVAGKGRLILIYSCLGLGLMSFFSAFVIAYPKKLGSKLLFLLCGIIVIQALNIARFVLLAIFFQQREGFILDHHTIFNLVLYLLIGAGMYCWVRYPATVKKSGRPID
jgi:exosortase/archaeosortase family protein